MMLSSIVLFELLAFNSNLIPALSSTIDKNHNEETQRNLENFLQLEEYFAKTRSDFPILNEKVHENKELIYLDSGASSQRPTAVLEAMNDYYYNYAACAGRSIHKVGTKTTVEYEEARRKTRRFINAKEQKEIIFTKNTTEGINLIARSLNLKRGDIVLTTDKEHNSNLVPWLVQKEYRNITYKIVQSNENNTFNLEQFENMMNKKVKLVSMAHTSNLDGYTIPADEIIKIAHDYNALVMLDGAQSATNKSINVQKLDVETIWFKGFGWSSESTWISSRHMDANYATMSSNMAYKMADIKNPKKEIDIAEVDDRFSYKELQHLEALGLANKGEAAKLLENGTLDLKGSLPINPSGGSLGIGNCFEATGLQKALEIVIQLRGHAGRRQISDAETGIAQSWRGIPTRSGAVAIFGR